MTRALYSVERDYPVSLERLWRAWTVATELEAWYSPVVLDVVPGSAVSDAQPGGNWKIAIDVPENGFVAYFWGHYLDVQPHVRLEHTMHYSQDEAEFVFADESGPAHRVVVDFAQLGDRAWVRYTQHGEMPEEQVEATRMGMDSYLDSLQMHLEAQAPQEEP